MLCKQALSLYSNTQNTCSGFPCVSRHFFDCNYLLKAPRGWLSISAFLVFGLFLSGAYCRRCRTRNGGGSKAGCMGQDRNQLDLPSVTKKRETLHRFAAFFSPLLIGVKGCIASRTIGGITQVCIEHYAEALELESCLQPDRSTCYATARFESRRCFWRIEWICWKNRICWFNTMLNLLSMKVPYTLAENAGMQPVEIVTQLRAAHAKGDKFAGINVKTPGSHNTVL